MTTLIIKDLYLAVDNKPLLNDLNATFSSGQVWGILGPNGAGKTTLLHVLAGLYKPKHGSILLDERNILQLKPRKRAQNIGLLLQDTEFPFPSTVLETAMIGRYPYQKHWFNELKTDGDMAKAALAQMHLKEFECRSITSLSGGERRRLALATLLTQDPAIYLLDEPTNHLDIHQQINTLSLLTNLAKKQNKVIVMILHDLHLLKTFCTHIMMFGYDKNYILGRCSEVLNEETLQRFNSISNLFCNEW